MPTTASTRKWTLLTEVSETAALSDILVTALRTTQLNWDLHYWHKLGSNTCAWFSASKSVALCLHSTASVRQWLILSVDLTRLQDILMAGNVSCLGASVKVFPEEIGTQIREQTGIPTFSCGQALSN